MILYISIMFPAFCRERRVFGSRLVADAAAGL